MQPSVRIKVSLQENPQYPPLIWLGNFFIFWHIPQAASYHGVLPSYQGHYKDMSWKRRQKRKKGGIDPWVIWDMSHWLITPSRKYNGKLGWPLQRTQPLKVKMSHFPLLLFRLSLLSTLFPGLHITVMDNLVNQIFGQNATNVLWRVNIFHFCCFNDSSFLDLVLSKMKVIWR